MISEFFHMLNPRYNERVKGALTIFLMIIMTPFVTIAFVMCEVGRYKNALNQVDEAIGLSTSALLANYDKFLQDRFGLYACTQVGDLNSLYQVYLQENLTGIRASMSSFNGCSVTGMYPLSDDGMLQYQIDEYMLFNGPATILNEVFDLDKLLGCFSIVESISGFAEKAEKGVETAQNAVDTCNAAQNLKNIAATITSSCVPTYNNAYTKLKSDVNAMLTKAAEEVPTITSGMTAEAIATVQAQITAHNNAVATLEATVIASRDAYATSIQNTIDKLNEFKETLGALDEATRGLQGNVVDYASEFAAYAIDKPNSDAQKQLDAQMELFTSDERDSFEYSQLENKKQELEDEHTNNENATNLTNAMITATESWSSINPTVGATELDSCIEELTSLKNVVLNYDYHNSNVELSDSVMHGVTVRGYMGADAIDAYFQQQADAVNEDDSWKDFLSGIGAAFDALFNTSLLYDASKDAVIKESYYTSNGLFSTATESGGISDVIDAIIRFCTSTASLVADIGTFSDPISYLVKILTDLKNVLVAIVDVVTGILSLATAIINRIGTLIQDPLGAINKSVYVCYNMSCRTEGPAIGKADSHAFPTAHNGVSGSNIPILSDAGALVEAIASSLSGGNSYSFCGCELEYIMYGRNCEIGNQTLAFLSIYLLRLLVDFPQILANPEVQEIASAAAASTVGIGYFAVMAITIFAEPLIDTLLLVNGVGVSLVKSPVFCTPRGIPEVISKFCEIGLDSAKTQAATDSLYDAYRIDTPSRAPLNSSTARPTDSKATGLAKWTDGFLELDYRDHLFLLYLLLPEREANITARLYNVIQMEGTQYYKETVSADTMFDLKKAYTMVNATANVSISPLLSDMYSDYSFFTMDRAIYRGY